MTKVEEMMEQFAEDYDLASMNYNDRLALEALCNLYIQVQDTVETIEEARKKEHLDTFSELVDINRKLIGNIETLEKQLGISRKARGQDKETSVINYVTDLQQRAKNFLQKKLHYIYCPNCRILLCTAWFLYQTESNELRLVCKRCKEVVDINTADFLDSETTEVLQERKNG